MINLLGEVFLRSQNVTDKEFIGNMERSGIEYTVHPIDTGTYVEVGLAASVTDSISKVNRPGVGSTIMRLIGGRNGRGGRPC